MPLPQVITVTTITDTISAFKRNIKRSMDLARDAHTFCDALMTQIAPLSDWEDECVAQHKEEKESWEENAKMLNQKIELLEEEGAAFAEKSRRQDNTLPSMVETIEKILDWYPDATLRTALRYFFEYIKAVKIPVYPQTPEDIFYKLPPP